MQGGEIQYLRVACHPHSGIADQAVYLPKEPALPYKIGVFLVPPLAVVEEEGGSALLIVVIIAGVALAAVAVILVLKRKK